MPNYQHPPLALSTILQGRCPLKPPIFQVYPILPSDYLEPCRRIVFFKIPSYDSSFDEDEVQQHSSSEEASREYMDPNLIPDRSFDIEEDDE